MADLFCLCMGTDHYAAMTGKESLRSYEPAIRLFVEDTLSAGAEIPLAAMQANYLLNVMRLKAGAELLVFNGRDGEWLARIANAAKSRCTLAIVEQTRGQTSGPDVHYLFAPLKRAKLDYVVQKAVEMGVASLRPVMTRRTVAERVNIERMRANAIEAAEQCGILRLPEIAPPEPLGKVLDRWPPERHIIYCDECAELASPIAALSAIAPGPLAVLIGPEGGFAPEERERLAALPFVHAVSLGPRVLRADTAAVASLALVNAILGDWK